MNKYLVVNAGSSSLKFSLYEMPQELELISGYVEKIGLSDSFWSFKINGEKTEKKELIKDHEESVKKMIEILFDNNIISSLEEIKGVGHRILHGGEIYSDSVIIDENVLKDITDLTKLGPLHHPGEIAGIRAMIECMPNTSQVAVFDTAFHQTMPKKNYMYPVPYKWYEENHVRRYGFHGTSHKYLTQTLKDKLQKENINLIICHVGSGASITCIENGKSINTSMGLTPLDGLMMGSRSGEIDPSIIKYIKDERNLSIDEITNILNKESGLLGISGKSDFRDVLELRSNGKELADLAYNMYKSSIIKHIAEYYFELKGRVDAIIFSAGVLENNSMLREDIINEISVPLSISLNKEINDKIGVGKELKEGIITTKDSKIPVYVLPTSEEIMILRDTYNLVKKGI